MTIPNCGTSPCGTHWLGCDCHEANWQRMVDGLLLQIEQLKLQCGAHGAEEEKLLTWKRRWKPVIEAAILWSRLSDAKTWASPDDDWDRGCRDLWHAVRKAEAER